MSFNYMKFLKSIHNIPEKDKYWVFCQNTLLSQFKMDEIKITDIVMRGTPKDDNFDTLKIKLEIHYSYGNSGTSIYRKTIIGIENAFQLLFHLKETHVSCKECSILFEKTKDNLDYCKECKFFVTFSKLMKKEPSICSICQDEVFRFELECGHSFHIGCLSGMEMKNAKCPNCRLGISKKTLKEIYKKDSIYDYDSDDSIDSDIEMTYSSD